MSGSVNYNELTLLERVARAAREETYSAALAWMLDDLSSPLSLSKRASILQHLVGDELQMAPERVLSIVADTEVNEIDILVRVDTSHKRVYVAIENKIKATDHKIQLSTYDEKLALLVRDEETHKIFLTLGGEAPRSGDGWKAVSYETLHQAIVAHGLETQSIHVRDFCGALERLASVVRATGHAETGLAAFAFGDTTIDPGGAGEPDRPQLFAYVARTRLQKAVQRTWLNALAGHFRKIIPERWAIS